MQQQNAPLDLSTQCFERSRSRRREKYEEQHGQGMTDHKLIRRTQLLVGDCETTKADSEGPQLDRTNEGQRKGQRTERGREGGGLVIIGKWSSPRREKGKSGRVACLLVDELWGEAEAAPL